MRLKYEAKNAWEFERENNKLDDVMNYSKGYMHFLDVGKTERRNGKIAGVGSKWKDSFWRITGAGTKNQRDPFEMAVGCHGICGFFCKNG